MQAVWPGVFRGECRVPLKDYVGLAGNPVAGGIGMREKREIIGGVCSCFRGSGQLCRSSNLRTRLGISGGGRWRSDLGAYMRRQDNDDYSKRKNIYDKNTRFP